MRIQQLNTLQFTVKHNNYRSRPSGKNIKENFYQNNTYITKPYQITFGNKITIETKEFSKKNIYQLQADGFQPIKIRNGIISNSNNYLLVSSKDDFKAITKTPSSWNKTFVLTNDIDLNDEEVSPIGNLHKSFTGIFDGNGYEIKNFKIAQPEKNNIGLFGISDKAEFKHLSLSNFSISGLNNVGAVSGVSTKCIFDSVETNGKIHGSNNIGGICGYDINSYLEKCITKGSISRKMFNSTTNFWEEPISEKIKFAGGLIGIADLSTISASQSSINIDADEHVGGFIGLAKECSLKDIVYSGQINSNDNKCGSFIGDGRFNEIKNSYSISGNPFIGKSYNDIINNSFSSIKDLTTDITATWDNGIWNLSPHKIPILKSVIKDINPADIYLHDIQNDVTNKIISITNIHYTPKKYIDIKLDDMAPPKHYERNNELLEKIKNSDSNSYLTEQFIYYTDEFRDNFNPHSHNDDEILLEIINNPHFNFNKRYEGFAKEYIRNFAAGTYCTPLYILSRMEKGYIFREALKKQNLDPYVPSGPERDTDMFKTQFHSTNTTNMFLLLTANNPVIQDYVKKQLKELDAAGVNIFQHDDIIANLLLNDSGRDFMYDEATQTLKIPRKLLVHNDLKELKFRGNDTLNNLYDILESPDIDPNYKDSFGNTILHILPNVSQKEQLILLNLAIEKGVNINLKNNEDKTPKELAIDSGNINLATRLTLNKPKDMFFRNENLDDIFMLNVKSKERYALANMIKLHELGFSINTQNKDHTTALIESIKNNDSQKANYLLSQGANVNICDINGQTALHHAFIQRNPQIIKWLLDKYAYPSVKDKLEKLPQDYWPNCQGELLKNGIDLDAIKQEYELSFNVKKVSHKEIQHADKLITEAREWYETNTEKDICNPESNLYKYDGQIYKFISTDLQNSNEINTNIINKILNTMITNYNPDGEEILLYVMQKYNYKLSDFNSYNSLLSLALDSYNNAGNITQKLTSMQYIKLLLDSNSNIENEDNNHQTPLYLAIFSKNLLIFNEILGKHPNINHTDLLGHTPLFYLGKDSANPMRKSFDIYAKKRNISLPNEYEQILKELTKKGFTIKK